MRGAAKPDKRRQNDLNQQISIDRIPANQLSPADWQEWRQLNDVLGGHPGLDSDFVSGIVSIFGNNDVMSVRVRRGSRPVLWLLAQRRGYGIYDAFTPPQAPYDPVLADLGDHDVEDICQTIRALPGPAMSLRLLRQRAEAPFIRTLIRSPLQLVNKRGPTTRVRIEGTFENYWSHRTRPRKQIDRQLKKLEREGILPQLVEHSEPRAVEAALVEYARLENAGWKGRNCSAIDINAPSGRFYRQLLSTFASQKAARVYQLYFSGELVASQLAVERGGTLALLKTAYDERFSSYGPGRLLDYFLLHKLHHERPGAVIDFCNAAQPDELRWATDVHSLTSITLFRTPAIRLFATMIRSARKALKAPIAIGLGAQGVQTAAFLNDLVMQLG